MSDEVKDRTGDMLLEDINRRIAETDDPEEIEALIEHRELIKERQQNDGTSERRSMEMENKVAQGGSAVTPEKPEGAGGFSEKEFRQRYIISIIVSLVVGVIIPFLWLVGFAEWYFHSTEGAPAKERYENPWLAGFMRLNEILVKLAVVLLVGGFVLVIVAAVIGTFVLGLGDSAAMAHLVF